MGSGDLGVLRAKHNIALRTHWAQAPTLRVRLPAKPGISDSGFLGKLERVAPDLI